MSNTYAVLVKYNREGEFQENQLFTQLKTSSEEYNCVNIGNNLTHFQRAEVFFEKNPPDVSFLFEKKPDSLGFIGSIVDLDKIIYATLVSISPLVE